MATGTLFNFSTLPTPEQLALGLLALCDESVPWQTMRYLLDMCDPGRRLGFEKALLQLAARRVVADFRARKPVKCPPELRDEALAALRNDPLFPSAAVAVMRALPAPAWMGMNRRRLERDFRLTAELNLHAMFHQTACQLGTSDIPDFLQIMEPMSDEWFRSRHPVIQRVLLELARHYSLAAFQPLGRYERLLLERAGPLAVQHLILSGRPGEAPGDDSPEALGWLALAGGRWEESARHFEATLKDGRSVFGKGWVLHSTSGLAYLLACVGARRRAQGQKYLKQAKGHDALLHWMGPLFADLPDRAHLHHLLDQAPQLGGLGSLPAGLVLAWRLPDQAAVFLPWLSHRAQEARRAGYGWLAEQLEAIGLRLQGRELPSGAWLVDMESLQLPWQQQLSALRNWSRGGEGPAQASAELRLVWEVNPGGLYAREQKRTRTGWGAPKPLSNTKLLKEAPAFASAQDRRILSHLYKDVYSRAPEFGERAWLELVGHPLVSWEGKPIQVVMDQPRLRLSPAEGGGVRLELSPSLHRPVVVDFSQSGLVRVYELGASLRPLYDLVGRGLEFPPQAQAELLSCLAEVEGKVSVESSLDHGEQRAADSAPCVLLAPLGEGLQVQVRVRPSGTDGPAVRPGQGSEDSLCQVGGRVSRVRRDHAAELAHCEALLAACPSLREAAEWNWDFSVGDLETSLACLEELQASGARLEWPQGQGWKVRPPLQTASLSLRVGAERDWFAVRGEVRLDERRVLQLRELLDLLDHQQGRFVQLGPGEFLALTHEFRRRLDELKRVTERTGSKLLLHPLASASLEALDEAGAEVEAVPEWTAHLQRWEEARALEPVVPPGLQAELRPYQEAGFQWLARLAHAGAGACLADDMGLGKTVQALALLLAQAERGPSLVVCPTSVVFNWLEEAVRFAPGLRFATLGRDREGHVAGLGSGDVLVVSYGLLASLPAREWQVIILDEAHYVKNARAKRAQAASSLRGQVRVALTGTPMENHLGEIWSLFRFLNPGLLGSEKSFGERFARPIESKDRAAAQTLRSLLAPFTLRRLKSQVLTELPPRTEIVRHVELEADERALYEATRQRSAERLASGEADLFHVLAELTRLRRLCCHPRLVVPDTRLPGSKLQAFLELVDELRENRHRALVFSQFVDHLAVVREALERRGVSFLYLDGQAPAAERGPLVSQFQAGKGELFLISLKAGGSGLNLTGADYVIHLDPWWNPAVEDQATDRAHRIGQLRPVTVYRLVTRDTVEEQILELHAHKRDLAEQLLAGQDGEARLDARELLALLRGEATAAGESTVAGQPEPAKRVLEWARAEGQVTTGGVMERLDLGRAQAKALLEELAQRRQLRRVGERGRGVHYVAD